ncbi:MAG TPA: LLM class F420-dependent oxidoreductase [Anaerolineae bacterium]|nr:LLM class F420-dependent oxidoreductase [Anaerolineae bacterium]
MDPVAIRDYAQTAEGLGFAHIEAYDHVLGANPDRPGGWKGPYTHESTFLEPFVLFSYMAGFTRKAVFATGVLILPQRQTALVAKQAATLDVLSGGRLRLGVGLGWNAVEYVALNQDFHTRGRRIEEQIALLRQLWTQPLVNFTGRWHTIPDAGIKPLPIQRPIPIWFGGHDERVLRRVARLADGWMPNRPVETVRPLLEQLDGFLAEAGRSHADLSLGCRISFGDGNPDKWSALLRDWQALGMTHTALNTMGSGFTTPAEHLKAIRMFAEAIGLPAA